MRRIVTAAAVGATAAGLFSGCATAALADEEKRSTVTMELCTITQILTPKEVTGEEPKLDSGEERQPSLATVCEGNSVVVTSP